MKSVLEYKLTNNSKVYKQLHRKLCADISCSFCPPNKAENETGSHSKHGKKKKWQLDPKKRHKLLDRTTHIC